MGFCRGSNGNKAMVVNKVACSRGTHLIHPRWADKPRFQRLPCLPDPTGISMASLMDLSGGMLLAGKMGVNKVTCSHGTHLIHPQVGRQTSLSASPLPPRPHRDLQGHPYGPF